MNDFIDIYCERLGPGLWAEPVNAVTNLAFIISAVMVFLLAKKRSVMGPEALTLSSLIFAIGIGSGLFHTFATSWAKFADVLPILLFQIAFLIFYSRRVMNLSRGRVAALFAAFVACTLASGMLPYDWLNGSLGYASALIFVTGFGIYHLVNAKQEPYILLAASGVFVLSLTFRSIDMDLCAALPLGTHFMWHVLNGVVLYLSARGLLVNIKR